MSALRARWPLALILLLAAALRLPGTFYPSHFHFDEGIYVQNVICAVPPGGTFYHPFLGRNLLAVAEALPCAQQVLSGTERPADATNAEFRQSPQRFLWLGRSLALLYSLLTIAGTWLLARRLIDSGARDASALLAAFLVAVSPGDVTLAMHLGHWCLATLAALLVFLTLQRVLEPDAPRRSLAWLGIAAGLAVAVVYTNALLALAVLTGLALRWRAQRAAGLTPAPLRELGWVALWAVLAHVPANFNAFLHPAQLLHELTVPEASAFSSQSQHIGYLTNLRWHVDTLFDRFGLGALVASLGLVALGVQALRQRGLWLAMLAFVLGVLFLQPLGVVLFAIRYTSPLTPLLVIGAAWLVVAAAARGAAALRQPTGRVAALLAVLIAMPALAVDFELLRALRLPSTRLQARDWIMANVPSGSSISQSIEFMGPPLPECAAGAAPPCYNVKLAPVDAEHFTDRYLAWLETSGLDYAIYTATTPPGTLRRMGRTVAVSGRLAERYQRVARFAHPGLDGFHDDTVSLNVVVEIYRLQPRSDAAQ